ncbi:hypothetical protein HDU76_008850 [Blyttiomyces sp. JEL0837]|nr:hypothetical protein HDU76_008850 [Blyttiomyces sp. JEL0837]
MCFGPCVLGCVSGAVHKQSAFDITACCCGGLALYRLRRTVQALSGIKEDPNTSICAISLCGFCAAVQDIHELKHRGVITSMFGQGTNKVTIQPDGQPTMSTA